MKPSPPAAMSGKNLMKNLLRYPHQVVPLPGELHEVAPGILWTRFKLPYQLNHVNVYLLEDFGGWTAVDAAIDGRATREAWETLLGLRLGGLPITRLIVTHFHPDHIGAANWLVERTGAPLAMTAAEHRMAVRMFAVAPEDRIAHYRVFYGIHGMDSGSVEDVVASGHDYQAGVGKPPELAMTIASGDQLDIGGRTFRVLTGSGHSPELAMLHDVSDNLLICADQVLARISPNVSLLPSEPDADPLGDYLSSIEALRDAVSDEAFVLPGHELPFFGLHARIEELSEHHRRRCAAIEKACRVGPMTAQQLVPHVFERSFDPYQLGFAMAETLAHINLLVGEHRLATDRNGGMVFYRAA